MLQVPCNRFAQAGLKFDRSPPAKLLADFCSIDCVTAIVTRPVGDERDQVLAGPQSGIRAKLVHQVADGSYNFQIFSFAIAADVIGLSHSTAFKHGADSRAMIFYIEPVANIASVSINRQRFAFKSVQNDERNKLLGKLERAVIVGAVGGEKRQAI